MNRISTSLIALAFAAGLVAAAEAQTVGPSTPTAPSAGTTGVPPSGPTNTTRDPANPATPTPSAPDTIAPDPAGPPTTPQPADATPLTKVENARMAVMNAKVKDNKGEVIGEVKRVTLGPDGKVASVSVQTGARTVMLKADTLNFAQADKTLQSTQTKDEIQQLPPT